MDNQQYQPNNNPYGAPPPPPPNPYGVTPPQPLPPPVAPAIQSKRKLYIISGIGILLIIIIIIVVAVILSSGPKKTNNSASTGNALPAQAVAFPPTDVIYQAFSSATSSVVSIVNTNSITTGQVTSSQTDPTFQSAASAYNDYFSNSSAALMTDGFTDNDVPTFSLLEADGTTIPVDAALDVTLEQILNNRATSNNIFISGSDEMLAIVPNSADPLAKPTSFKFDSINLSTGVITNLLSVTPLTTKNEYFIPENINPGDNLMSFLASNVVINERPVQNAATITYNLFTNKFNINVLPANVSTDVQLALNGVPTSDYVGVSPDGNVIAYQTSSNGFSGIGPYVTHVLTINGGQNVTSTGVSMQLGGSAAHTSFYFSSDDKYVAINGYTYPSSNPSGDASLQAIETSTGTLVQDYDVGSKATNSINPLGWDDQDSLIYITNTTQTSGLFNAATAQPHDINLPTAKADNFPTNLGQPAVLIDQVPLLNKSTQTNPTPKS